MIKITFVEPVSEDWLNWKNNCQQATTEIINSVNQAMHPTVTNLYKDQKPVFVDTKCNFFGKCAYCESLITNNQPGDVDHYRPKGRVMDANNKPVMITTALGENPHPGYYWLAYQFSNLLPSCIDCNRP